MNPNAVKNKKNVQSRDSAVRTNPMRAKTQITKIVVIFCFIVVLFYY